MLHGEGHAVNHTTFFQHKSSFIYFVKKSSLILITQFWAWSIFLLIKPLLSSKKENNF